VDDIQVGSAIQALPDIGIVAGAGQGGSIAEREERINELLTSERLDYSS
jgi:hypothetical protein